MNYCCGVVSGMDRRSAVVATGKVRQLDGYHTEGGQDMAAGTSSHERVSTRAIHVVVYYRMQIRLRTCDKIFRRNKTRTPVTTGCSQKRIRF